MDFLKNTYYKYKDIFFKLCIFALLIFAVVSRYQAIAWNKPYFHDNFLYANAAQSLAERGDFKVSTTYISGIPHEYSVAEKGGEYLDHNPMWPILGALVIWVKNIDGFAATAFLSFISGLGVLALVYLVGAKLGGKHTGGLAFLGCLFSYILIDFSGNGSFYIFQAFLYLLFIYLAWEFTGKKRVIALGIVTGISILVVQQSITLIFAYLVYLILFERKDLKTTVLSTLLFLSIIALCSLPWAIRNHYALGAFFPPADTYYVWDKLGVSKEVTGDVTRYLISSQTYLQLVKTELTTWFPNNSYYINRQLFILTPVFYSAALLLFCEALFCKWLRKLSPDELKKIAFLGMVLGFHIAISAAWPITKFRYFVSMVPLVTIAGAYYMNSFLERLTVLWFKKYCQFAAVISVVILSILTYYRSPSHTFYYGGVLTTDPFGQNGEVDYVQNYKHIPPRDPKL